MLTVVETARYEPEVGSCSALGALYGQWRHSVVQQVPRARR